MKAYTVQELDALRTVVEKKYLWGSYRGPWPLERNVFSREYREADKNKAVEEMVRTHMLAGHTAEELIASETVALEQQKSPAA